METIYYGHVPPARDRRTSEGCPGVVLRATRGDRNNIPYSIGASSSKDAFKLSRVLLLLYRALSIVYSGGVGK